MKALSAKSLLLQVSLWLQSLPLLDSLETTEGTPEPTYSFVFRPHVNCLCDEVPLPSGPSRPG